MCENVFCLLFKIKLGMLDDMFWLEVVWCGVLDVIIIVDVNEGWLVEVYVNLVLYLVCLGVVLVE